MTSGRLGICALLLAGCSARAPSPGEAISNLGTANSSGGSSAIVIETWNDATNVFPATLAYTVAANYDANYCELYVDSIADADFTNGGATVRWIDAHVRTSASQSGKVLNVGMYTATADGESFMTLSAPAVSANDYETGFTYAGNMLNVNLTVVDFAFFADVQRSDGSVVRLWQSNGGANFQKDDVFASTSTVDDGGTSYAYANGSSSIFHQKDACD